MNGAGANAPSGPPWISTIVGSGVSAASGGDAIHVSIGPPGPGAWMDRIVGQASPCAQRLPNRVRIAGACAVGAPVGTVRSSIGRFSTVETKVTRDSDGASAAVATARLWAARSPVASGVGAEVARPDAGSISNRHGADRPRSDTSAMIVPASSQHGVFLEDAVQPCRSVSTQLPIGRSSSGASGHAGAEPSAGPTTSCGLASSSAPSSMVPIAAIQRPSGDQAGECT